MKVLLFSPTLEMGGAEKIISRFYFFLKKKLTQKLYYLIIKIRTLIMVLKVKIY